MPIANVLLPLDGSELAALAVDSAVELALACEVPLELVTVAPWEGVDVDEAAYLDDIVSAIAGPGAPQVRTDVLRHHTPADAIARAAGRLPGTIVVMATHGRSGAGRVALGSVAEGVVTSSGEPVLLFGPSIVGPPVLRGGLALVAIDGSHHADEILPDVVALARALELRLRLVWVRESDLLGDLQEPLDHLEARRAELADLGFAVDVVVLDGAHPARVLATHAFEHTAVLCAAATHGRSGVARAALGSVASALVHESPCAVLVRRPGGADTVV